MPILVPQQPPPPDYYAAKLRYLLQEVWRRSGALLAPDERRQVESFARLGTDGQRLFARLLARSSVWLRVDSLAYREVGDREAALRELCAAGLVERAGPAPADALLNLLTRAELQAAFPGVRGATKPEWIRQCVTRYPDASIRHRLALRHPWITVTSRCAFHVCQVLFFGGDGQDLSAFVMQDLGIHTYEDYSLAPHTRPFSGRRELERFFLCMRLRARVGALDGAPEAAALVFSLLQRQPAGRIEQRARDRLLNRLGRWHERRGEASQAESCYRQSTSHPARERLARLLHARGDRDAVRRLLERMRQDPWAPEEQDFAARFPRRCRAVRPATSVVSLRGATPPAIEAHAEAMLTGNGGRAWHLENLLPLGLAGLVFWQEVFAPIAGAFSHPLQMGPQDLFWPDFARARRQALEARIASLEAPGALERQVRSVFRAKQGVANRLVHWGAITEELIDALLVHVPHGALTRLAVRTIGNLHRARTGFPDLLVIYGPGAWELVEVKGPNDQLQPAQRVWLEALQALSLPARVLRFKAAC